MLEVLEALQQFIHAEVHRPHVQRRDFRLELRGRQHAFADRQHGRTAGGDIDDHIALRLDARQKLRVQRRVLRGPARLGIARVQMHDGRACLSGIQCRLRDLVGGDGQIGRHRRRMHRTGNGARDDHIALGFFHGPWTYDVEV
ncbi:hypothetical protein D3C71_1349200 [compost metagenome]